MQHFIDLAEWSSADVRKLLELAIELKAEWRNGGNIPLLQGQTLALVFQKPSLRTRVSFEVGMRQLGGSSLTLSPDEIGLGKRESTADIARILSGYVQGIMARVFEHQHLVEMAKYASIPVINGLSDAQHPCQALADLLTIREHFGTVEGVRVAFVGDGNNVALSVAQAVSHFGGEFVLGAPAGYSFTEDQMSNIDEIAARNNAKLELYEDPYEAVKGANVIYTDTWVSMGQEAESDGRIAAMQPYQVNAKLLAHAGKDAIVLHCLPAHRGQEITDEIADGKQSLIFPQAENRLHAQKAILVELLSNG